MITRGRSRHMTEEALTNLFERAALLKEEPQEGLEEKLKYLMRVLRMSQTELSKKSGVSQQPLTDFFKKRRSMRWESMTYIFQVFKIDYMSLIDKRIEEELNKIRYP